MRAADMPEVRGANAGGIALPEVCCIKKAASF
jgi:hypothetical protein